jgi:hypothetical protein
LVWLPPGVRLQLRAEAFNLLNHTNFAIANQYRNISTAGNYTLTVTFPPRVIQFAGRLEFLGASDSLTLCRACVQERTPGFLCACAWTLGSRWLLSFGDEWLC